MKSFSTSPFDDFESDQQLKLPQPPLVKAAMTDQAFPLPRNFAELEMKQDFIRIVTERKSSRVYSGQPISLLQLSFCSGLPRASKTSAENPMPPCGLSHRVGRAMVLKPICWCSRLRVYSRGLITICP